MANAAYNTGRNAFLLGDVDWVADTIKVILIDTADYSVDLASHQFLSDVPAAARVSTGSLANKTASAGVADADDLTLTSVTGDQCEALIIYKDTGVEGTSQLLLYIDTLTGLPITPNGGNITIQWDNGSNKIFKILG